MPYALGFPEDTLKQTSEQAVDDAMDRIVRSTIDKEADWRL